MATAVQSGSEVRTPTVGSRLTMLGLLGAIYVLGGIALALYVTPQAWKSSIGPVIARSVNSETDSFLRLIAQVGVFAIVVRVGAQLADANHVRGLRGAVFLFTTAIIGTLATAKLIGDSMSESSIGLPVTLLATGALLGFLFRYLTGDHMEPLAVTVENQGWFGLSSYKRLQGVRVRRYTLLGFLGIIASGVYTLKSHRLLEAGDWVLSIPFTDKVIPLLGDKDVTLPILLLIAGCWVAWRAVNVPTFADFLIATDAEMVKVSWSSRKRLIQDTIVVLVTVVILTSFLLLVDLFWGWLLSSKPIGVLPSRPAQVEQVDPAEGSKNW